MRTWQRAATASAAVSGFVASLQDAWTRTPRRRRRRRGRGTLTYMSFLLMAASLLASKVLMVCCTC